ncbi:MAG: quinate 5-dehydrogenase [Caldanaerobacter subterraneus]|nr:quinate 5-dehydrogenase [Caldanaerobacter subterraneus]
MKRVVSISLGSSTRNKKAEIEILGEKFIIERIGTDGDLKKAVEMIKELDGKVDAFGMGGIDLYLSAGNKRYVIRDALPLKNAAKITPIVDGSGLKNTLERRVIKYIQQKGIVDLRGKKVLITSAMDRYGMAKAFEEEGASLIIGDLMFALNVPIPLHSLRLVYFLSFIIVPVVVRLPFEMIYPTGEKQLKMGSKKYERFYKEADIIAGDFLFIKRFMPENLKGKVIVTNTVTPEDVETLRQRGVEILITTTPNINGRSFGTNVMEGVLVAIAGKKQEEMTTKDYEELLDKIGFEPRVEYLQKKGGNERA